MAEIDFGKIEQQIVDEAIKAINDSLVELKKEVDSQTPIDTGKLVVWNQIRFAESDGFRVEWSVYNDVDYVPYVEYGVGWKVYNYHRFGKIFFAGVGARMFTKAYDKLKNKIIKDIRNRLR